MFYKDYLPVIRRDDLCALTECIVVEVNLWTKSLFFTCNYRSNSSKVKLLMNLRATVKVFI